MKPALLGLIFLLLNMTALAMDGQHLARITIETIKQNKVIQYAWIDSQSNLQFDTTGIIRANGVKLMNTPKTAGSYNGIQYDVSHFYTDKKPRINMVIHYAGRTPGEILSLGIDSGFATKKIKIKPALFVGYSRALNIAKNTHIAFNVNGWLGGKILEQSCKDDYNREYHCPTLTAWSDYKPINNTANFEQSIVFKYNF